MTPERSVGEVQRDLNRQLYEQDPAGYVLGRIGLARSLLPDEAGTLGDDGRVVLRLLGIDERRIGRHLTIDSQLILHQAAEAALRIYFGHRPHLATRSFPDCPWVEIASERDAGRFKKRVASWLKVAALRDTEPEASWVFLGGAERPDDAPPEWDGGAGHLLDLLCALASKWLAEAPAYNALKHGMVAAPGEARFIVALEKGEAARHLADGTSIDFLESDRWVNDERQWRLTTRWIDVVEALNLAEAAARMIRSAWQIAAGRYVSPRTVDVWLPTCGPIDLRGPVRGSMTRFSLNLFKELK